MTDLDAFTEALGVRQGRVRSSAIGAPYVLVLGDVEAHRVHDLNVGDFVEWRQEADLAPNDIVRVRGSLSTPKDMPEGLAWELSITIRGRKVARVIASPGRTQRLDDLAAFAGDDVGRFIVALRLELVSTA